MKKYIIYIMLIVIFLTSCTYKTINSPILLQNSGIFWDDVYIPLTAGRTAGVNDPDFNVFNGSTRAWEFQNNILVSQDEIYFTFQMPHRYKINSTFDGHLHYTMDSANTGFANISLECSFADIYGEFNNTFTTVLLNNTLPFKHNIVNFPLEYSCTTISCIAQCELMRQSAAASDTYASGVFIHAVDFHIQMDSDGSVLEYVK